MREVTIKKRAPAKSPVLVLTDRISAAGVFVTPRVVEDIKHSIRSRFRELRSNNPNARIRVFIHLKSHGTAQELPATAGLPGKEKPFSLLDTKMVEKGMRCGMRGAGDVAEELEKLILRDEQGKPKKQLEVLTYNGKRYAIRSGDDLRRMNGQVYGARRALAGDLVTSIADERRHIRQQKSNLRIGLEADRWISSLKPYVTAGVQNYETGQYARVDENEGLWTLEDEMHKRMQEKYKESGDHADATAKQTPEIILFHPTDVMQARATGYLAANPDGEFSPNKVFAISGSQLHNLDQPLDPYKTMGLFYALEHLKTKRVVLLGRNSEHVEQIAQKINNDPYAAFVLRHFGITLEKKTLDHLSPSAQKVQAAANAAKPQHIPDNVELHIRVGCSDARDIGKSWNDVELQVIREAAEGKIRSTVPQRARIRS